MQGMARVYRYVFYRTLLIQRRATKTRREAGEAAALYVSAAPMLTLFFVSYPWVGPHLENLSRGALALAVLLLLGFFYLPHYVYLGRREQVTAIEDEFHRNDPFGYWGTTIVAVFFAVPIATLIFFIWIGLKGNT